MQRFVEAYNRHDVEAMLENLEPEVEWHSDILAALGGEARVYRGREGFRDGLRDLFEALGETHIEFPEIRDLGDRVIAIGRIRARGKGSGAETESLHATVVDLKDGKAVRIWAYLDPQEALEAAGLWSRAMSQQGLEIVRRSYDHFNRTGGPDFSLLDPAVVLDTSNAVFVRARFRGHAGFRDWLATQRDMWRSQRLEAEELIPVGEDRVIVCLRVVGVGRDGIETVAHVANITTLRSGRVSYVRVFLTKAEAVEAAGLSEQPVTEESVVLTLRQIDAVNRRDAEAFVATLSAEVEMGRCPLLVRRFAGLSGESRGPRVVQRGRRRALGEPSMRDRGDRRSCG